MESSHKVHLRVNKDIILDIRGNESHIILIIPDLYLSNRNALNLLLDQIFTPTPNQTTSEVKLVLKNLDGFTLEYRLGHFGVYHYEDKVIEFNREISGQIAAKLFVLVRSKI